MVLLKKIILHKKRIGEVKKLCQSMYIHIKNADNLQFIKKLKIMKIDYEQR